MTMLDSGPCDWLVLPALLPIRFHWIVSDGVVNGIGRNGNDLILRLRFRRGYDSAYDSTPISYFHWVIRSYDSDYDFVASENQPLEDTEISVCRIPGGYALCEYNIPRAAQNIDGAHTNTALSL